MFRSTQPFAENPITSFIPAEKLINEHKQGSMALWMCWSWTFHLVKKICRHFNAALKIDSYNKQCEYFFLYNFARNISNEWRSTMTLSYCCSTNNTSTTTLNWLIHKDKDSVFDIPLSLQFTNIPGKKTYFVTTFLLLLASLCIRVEGFFYEKNWPIQKNNADTLSS